MTKEEFKKVLDVQGGQFDFQIGRYEGMIGIIWRTWMKNRVIMRCRQVVSRWWKKIKFGGE